MSVRLLILLYRNLEYFLMIVIEGPGKTNVVDARRRVEIIVWTNRDRERPTHFISIPLTTSHIRDRLLEFISSVINCYTEKVSNS